MFTVHLFKNLRLDLSHNRRSDDGGGNGLSDGPTAHGLALAAPGAVGPDTHVLLLALGAPAALEATGHLGELGQLNGTLGAVVLATTTLDLIAAAHGALRVTARVTTRVTTGVTTRVTTTTASLDLPTGDGLNGLDSLAPLNFASLDNLLDLGVLHLFSRDGPRTKTRNKSMGDCGGLPGTDAGKTGHVYELDAQTCSKWFGDTGRYGRVGTIGEGSCFFHSVCFALNIDDYAYKKTEADKKKFVHSWRCDFIGKAFTEDDFKVLRKPSETFKSVKKRMCSPTSWADETMIRFASKLLNANIIFVDMRKKETYCGIHHDKILSKTDTSLPTVLIAWVNYEHFEPIVRIDNPETGLLQTSFKYSDPMVQHLLQAYKSKCDL